MPALINIEVYESLEKFSIEEIEIKLNNFQNNSDVKFIENDSEYPNYSFEELVGVTFLSYRRDLQLHEKWHVIEFCTPYENILQRVNKQIQFNDGVRDGLVKILKKLNEHFLSPIIVVTNEICNGFFFENKFGTNSVEFAEFELGLIKRDNANLIELMKYNLLEENEDYNIYIQENEFVKWK